jgi:hypothetical protein
MEEHNNNNNYKEDLSNLQANTAEEHAPENNSLVHEPALVLKALINSKENGTCIGIASPILGVDMFITAVDDIVIEEGKTTIVLKHYDTTGFILPVHKVRLDEITSVQVFSSPFKNPYLENLHKDKTWFF